MRVLYPEGPKHTDFKCTSIVRIFCALHRKPAHVEGGLAEQRTNGTAGDNHPVNQWRRQAHPAQMATIKYHLIGHPDNCVTRKFNTIQCSGSRADQAISDSDSDL